MRRATARARLWPALLLTLIPGLLAPKGCYFGEQDVPLGGNLDASGGGQVSGDDFIGAAGSDANGGPGSAGTGARPGTEMRDPGVFLAH